jgi:hypothetical protein
MSYDCTIMEMYCLERAKLEPRNRGKWIAQAERWHELARARNSWRHQKKPLQQSMDSRPDGNTAWHTSAELTLASASIYGRTIE